MVTSAGSGGQLNPSPYIPTQADAKSWASVIVQPRTVRPLHSLNSDTCGLVASFLRPTEMSSFFATDKNFNSHTEHPRLWLKLAKIKRIDFSKVELKWINSQFAPTALERMTVLKFMRIVVCYDYKAAIDQVKKYVPLLINDESSKLPPREQYLKLRAWVRTNIEHEYICTILTGIAKQFDNNFMALEGPATIPFALRTFTPIEWDAFTACLRRNTCFTAQKVQNLIRLQGFQSHYNNAQARASLMEHLDDASVVHFQGKTASDREVISCIRRHEGDQKIAATRQLKTCKYAMPTVLLLRLLGVPVFLHQPDSTYSSISIEKPSRSSQDCNGPSQGMYIPFEERSAKQTFFIPQGACESTIERLKFFLSKSDLLSSGFYLSKNGINLLTILTSLFLDKHTTLNDELQNKYNDLMNLSQLPRQLLSFYRFKSSMRSPDWIIIEDMKNIFIHLVFDAAMKGEHRLAMRAASFINQLNRAENGKGAQILQDLHKDEGFKFFYNIMYKLLDL